MVICLVLACKDTNVKMLVTYKAYTINAYYFIVKLMYFYSIISIIPIDPMIYLFHIANKKHMPHSNYYKIIS